MKTTYATGIFSLAVDKEIDYKNSKIVSHSQISMYEKCPKSWELRYVRKHKISDESIYLVFGQAMHEVIQEWLKVMYTKTIKASDELDTNKMLMDAIKREYVEAVERSGVHFSTPEELGTYYTSGVEIMSYLKKKRIHYFSTRHLQLVGIELPIQISPDPSRPSIILQGYLDLVFYDKTLNKYKILDIKTSKRGWGDWDKKDKTKVNQLVLYKKYFSEIFNVPLESIDVEYFIVKQQIDLDSVWPQKRVQQFKPSNGTVTVRKVIKDFEAFLKTCFDENGEYIDRNHPAIAGAKYYNCRFCPYNENEELCPKDNRITNLYGN